MRIVALVLAAATVAQTAPLRSNTPSSPPRKEER
jgi:hypothetical protein